MSCVFLDSGLADHAEAIETPKLDRQKRQQMMRINWCEQLECIAG